MVIFLNRSGQIARRMSIGWAQVLKTSEARPIFLVRIFLPCKQEKTLNLQVFIEIGKTMKILH